MAYTPPTIATYTPTLANATASGDTTIVSFTVPANTWLDGETIITQIWSLIKNNSGAGRSTDLKFQAGAGAAVTVYSVTWADSATEYRIGGQLMLTRVGADVWGHLEYTSSPHMPGAERLITAGNPFSSVAIVVSTPTNFTSDFTLAIIINLAVTDAAYYYKPQSARVMKDQAWW